jgi:hypothetical protein
MHCGVGALPWVSIINNMEDKIALSVRSAHERKIEWYACSIIRSSAQHVLKTMMVWLVLDN